MKRVLITGAGSYIGQSFEKWTAFHYPGQFQTYTVDMIDGDWRETDFSGYDTVFHVAGIVHRKEKTGMQELYYTVNTKLPIATAKKAKLQGVKQFVFMSSMSVYGKNVGTIKKSDIPIPKSYYGESKLNAEKALKLLENEEFKVAILRPPMVYGEGCKGNYQILKRFALKCPVFPDYRNERSMIHIDCLSDFVAALIQEGGGGLYFPQNKEYVSTVELVKEIGVKQGKRIRTTRVFNKYIDMGLRFHIQILEKVFGNLVYEKEEKGL